MRKLILLLALAAVAGALHAQIAVDNTATLLGPGGQGNGSTVSFAVGSGANRVLVVVVAGEGPTSVTSVTYAGLSLTKSADCAGWICQIWSLVNPPTGTSNAVVVWPTLANSWEKVDVGVVSFSGVSQSTPISATAANPTTSTVTITSLPGGWIVGAAVGHNGTFSGTPVPLLYDVAAEAPTSVAGYTGPLAAGSNTLSWTYTGGTGTQGIAAIALAPAALPAGPVILTGPACAPNSPSSVSCSWTTDIKSDSDIKCGPVSGGPYLYDSDVIDPVDTVTPADFWGVTSHAMASGGVPNGAAYCIALSKSKGGTVTTSTEVTTATTASSVSRPITISSIGPYTRWSDEHSGANGAPLIPGQYTGSDHGYFTWADDDNTYAANLNGGIGGTAVGGGHTLAYGFVAGNKGRYVFSNLATGWQNGANNMNENTFANMWDGGAVISVKGAMYTWHFDFPLYRQRFLSKTTDHFQSTLASTHNVGPATTTITNMTCSGGSITATSLLNLTDSFATVTAGKMAMLVAGAAGTNVNGVFGPVTAVTPTTVTWTQTALAGSCGAWTWTSGGTLNTYGWDVTANGITGIIPGSFVQCDGKDYACTKAAGLDAYVYFWNWTMLCRIRLENLPTQLDSAWGCYTGKQFGDDGLYSFNWDYASRLGVATSLNPVQFALSPNGRGASFVQELYVPAFNRFILAYEIAAPMDSWGGGEMIYDAGQYPWSPITPIGQAQRNVDVYVGATPQFPQFDARTMTQVDADTVSISLAHDGANWISTNPALSFLSFYTNRDVIITPRGATQAPPALQEIGKEVVSGLDLAYDFDVLTGSLSMPNKAPADAKQTWAWRAPNNGSPLWIDRYGSFDFSSINNSNPEFTPTDKFFSNVVLTTPYTQPLNALTLGDCFGHYPTTMMYSPLANAIALQKSGDLLIAWAGGNNWAVTFKGTLLGNVPIADGSIGCIVVRRDSQNRVTVYNSGAIGANLPLTPVLGPTVVAGAWSTTPLVMGDAANSFWGIESLLRVWSRDLGDDELIREMNTVRAKLRPRGPGLAMLP